eukprot:TRINITY_DN352_c0_g1_i2.p1 TRINITY_DN352_c0_g1~~TRINITY_DN352_c0_g1_i2.p1  ORF type:complete len:187 (+),score=54.20 TRINITY_DN352_c0_g1_i2:111-671(+)
MTSLNSNTNTGNNNAKEATDSKEIKVHAEDDTRSSSSSSASSSASNSQTVTSKTAEYSSLLAKDVKVSALPRPKVLSLEDAATLSKQLEEEKRVRLIQKEQERKRVAKERRLIQEEQERKRVEEEALNQVKICRNCHENIRVRDHNTTCRYHSDALESDRWYWMCCNKYGASAPGCVEKPAHEFDY